uniref:Actin-related protein 10 n=1 Tax=Peronospora matthiolae TaxID=2874970 RepID=A0AAV1TC72_9STRA
MNSSLKPLVLELGARYVRCGVSGERAPRCVERWEMAEMLQTPLSAATWRQFLYFKLHSVFYNLLLVNPTRRRVVVCEDLLLPRVVRETLLSVLFDMLQVSAVTLVPSMLAVLYATANHTALVVDCGWAETRMLPVFKGIPLLHLYTTVPAGSRDCCNTIRQELDATCGRMTDSSDFVSPITQTTAEDILERACFVQQMGDLSLNPVDATFQHGDNDVLQVSRSLRARVTEQLVLGEEDKDKMSIVDGILQVVKESPLDVRAALLQNLLFVGGTAMISGLVQRVIAEVRKVLQNDNELASATDTADRVQLVQTYFPRNMLAWVGGSVYAATDSARASAILSNEYSSSKGTCIPDWLNVAQ